MRWTFPASLRLFTLWVALALIGFVGVTYVTFYLAQSRYFTARNFRILTAIGEQVDQAVGAQSRVFKSLLTEKAGAAAAPPTTIKGPAPSVPAWYTEAGRNRNVSSLQYVAEPRRLPAARLPATGEVTSRIRMRSQAGQLLLELTYTHEDPARAGEPATVDLRLGAILQTIMGQRRYLDAFDAFIVADADGQVWYATSTARDVLRFNRLDALTDGPSGSPTAARFKALAQSSNVVDVTANGTAYRLFVQPCCRSLTSAPEPGRDASALVIAGLVATSRLNASSMTVSFTLVVVFGAVLLLGLLSFPFLKLMMMGETQRVTASHVLLVGTCSVAGMALLSVFLLNWYGYTRFNTELDSQLVTLAAGLSDNFRKDIEAAYDQMTCLTSRGKPEAPAVVADRDNIQFECRKAGSPATLYETFALVNADGMQYYKVGTDPWVPAQISVAQRAYFSEVTGDRAWTWKPPPAASSLRAGIYIDSIQAWTSGNLRAIVAAPTTYSDLPVATITIPLRSLIDPVVVPGFQFAVVDHNGLVLFHSDAQRNGRENLFAETDVNRRLRAAVVARQSRLLTLRYWGRDHRAYLQPLGAGIPLALVTLYDKQSGWELQQEWLVAAIGLVLLYLLVWLAMVAVLLINPRRRATWLWPHPSREAYYQTLSVLYLTLLGLTAIALVTLHGTTLVAVATTLALVGCLLTFLVLRSAVHATSESTGGSIASYVNAAVLCLILTAVAPAVVFFVTAHHLHADTYVKYRQLKLADAVDARVRRVLRRDEAHLPVAQDPGIYAAFFYGTEVQEPTTGTARAACNLEPRARETGLDLIPSTLEDWFLYQSEMSAEMRELLDDGRDEDHWHWRHGTRAADDAECLTLMHGGKHVASATPRLLATSWFGEANGAERGAPLARLTGSWFHLLAIAAILVVVAHLLVRFVCAKVFMIELEHTLPGKEPLVGASGDNEFVWFSGTELPTAAAGCCRIDLEELHLAGQGETAGDKWFEALAGMDRPDCQVIVLDNFDVDMKNTALAETKLELLDELVRRQNRVVVLTSKTSPRLAAGRIPALRERWNELLREFVVRDQRDTSSSGDTRDAPDPDWSWARTWDILRELWRGWRPAGEPPLEGGAARTSADALREYRRARALAALRGEGDNDAVVTGLCSELRERITTSHDPPTPGQVREEIDHRVAAHYRGIWATCSTSEKLVMAHVVQDGLVNPRSRRLVQRLVLRKLVRTCPELRLMNGSFERFALSDERRGEIKHFEQEHIASAWDSFRFPFVAAMVGGCLFLVVTQKQLFDSTIASLGAVATTVPAVVRAIGLSREHGLAQNQSRTSGERRA